MSHRENLLKQLRVLRAKPGEIDAIQQLGILQGRLDELDFLRDTLPRRLLAEEQTRLQETPVEALLEDNTN